MAAASVDLPFQFTGATHEGGAPQQPAADALFQHADPLLQQTTALVAVGTVKDVPELLKPLAASSGSSAEVRTACCKALGAIAQRGDFVDEAGRPLQDALQRLRQLARCDPDGGVQQAAAAAVSAVDEVTSYLPAWELPTSRPTSLTQLPPPPTWTDVLNDPTGASASAAAAPAVAPATAPAAPAAAPAAKRSRGPSAQELGVRPSDQPLYQALIDLRARVAQGKPAYTVASNEVLVSIATSRPSTRAQLLSLKGIGAQKADAYGNDILACVAKHPRADGDAADVAGSPTLADDVGKPAEPAAQLSPEQVRAVEAASHGDSIFLTGGAGSGKSFTLKKIIEVLQMVHGKENVFVTASTGIAACAIGGTTVHSFAGIGLGRDPAKELADKVMSKQIVRKRWQQCTALVVDEISMLDGALFEKLDYVARTVRQARRLPVTCDPGDAPFGGIQLVLCGDVRSRGSNARAVAPAAVCAWASAPCASCAPPLC